jgi:replicative DNA helicase
MAVERLGDADLDALGRESRAEERDLSLPPHSIQAEEAVLGSILKNPASIVRVSDFLRPEDFYQQRNRHVFRAMLALFTDGIPIDYHSTADRLQQLGVYEASGGLLYLSELNLATPSAAHIEYYGRIVERTSIMRQLIAKAQTIAEIAYRDNLDAETALEKAEQLILSVSERRVTRDFGPLDEVLSEYMEQVQALKEGEFSRYAIQTGYADLDKLLGGFQRTDLIILAARTSVGKTSLALNLAVNAAVKHNVTVAIFSLEMSAEQLASRLLSMESGVDSARIRSPYLSDQESRKLDAAVNHLAKAPIWVDDTPAIPIMELRSKARRLAAEHGVDLIVVDYLQLVSSDGGESRVQELGQVSRALKALARELRVPILALSQLSRAVEQRTPHIPQLSDLRESGAIEQDADVVLFIYRDEKYNPDSDKKGIADVIVAKHRNGPTGKVQLLFLERTTKFLDLELYRS